MLRLLAKYRAWRLNRTWPEAECWNPDWDRFIVKPPTEGTIVTCDRDVDPHSLNWHGHRTGWCERPWRV